MAKITPAAKAFADTKRLPSVLRKWLCFPIIGIAMPIMPPKRIEAMAMSLRMSADEWSLQISSSEDPQLEFDIDLEIASNKTSAL